MVDRIELIRAATPAAKLKEAAIHKLNELLDKALATILVELDLDAARGLAAPAIQELEDQLGALTMQDLKKLSARWEPNRKLDVGTTATELRASLCELLNGKRPPYQPLTMELAEALALDDHRKAQIRTTIEQIAPATDLKKLLKKWDKHNTPDAQTLRTWYSARAIELISGAEPVAKPAKGKPKKAA
jgi:hypothetical protein